MCSDITSERNRSVVTHGIPEPFLKCRKYKGRAMRFREVNVFRKVEISEHAAIKRITNLGRWLGIRDSGCRDSRPKLAKSNSARHRDEVLTSADRIMAITREAMTAETDDTSISKIKAKDAEGSLEMKTTRLQVSKLGLQNLDGGGQLNDIPYGRAGSERN